MQPRQSPSGSSRLKPLLCSCRQVKRFLGEVDSNLQHINDLRQELKNNLPFGALPETAESQYSAFVVRRASQPHCTI